MGLFAQRRPLGRDKASSPGFTMSQVMQAAAWEAPVLWVAIALPLCGLLRVSATSFHSSGAVGVARRSKRTKDAEQATRVCLASGWRVCVIAEGDEEASREVKGRRGEERKVRAQGERGGELRFMQNQGEQHGHPGERHPTATIFSSACRTEQVDPEVLAALPDEIQAEIRAGLLRGRTRGGQREVLANKIRPSGRSPSPPPSPEPSTLEEQLRACGRDLVEELRANARSVGVELAEALEDLLFSTLLRQVRG